MNETSELEMNFNSGNELSKDELKQLVKFLQKDRDYMSNMIDKKKKDFFFKDRISFLCEK